MLPRIASSRLHLRQQTDHLQYFHHRHPHTYLLRVRISNTGACLPVQTSTPVPSSAFALDLFGFGRYTSSPGAAGALSFPDPLDGIETSGSSRTHLMAW